MGKSKKSTPKVDAAPAAVPESAMPLKKGKREAEETIEKSVSSKKQKVEIVGGIVTKKLTETKTRTEKKKKKTKKKKKDETSSSESDDEPKIKPPAKKGATPLKAQAPTSSDDSDSEDEPVAKATAAPTKQPPVKNAPVKSGKKNSNSDSSDSSDSESDDSGDESKGKAPVKKLPSGILKNGSKKSAAPSDDSDSESDTSSEEEKSKVIVQSKSLPTAAKKGSFVAPNKKAESSSSGSSDSDDSDHEEKMEVDNKTPAVAKTSGKVHTLSDSSSGSETSDDEIITKVANSKVSRAQLQNKKDKSESESESEEVDDSDSDEDEVPAKPAGSLKKSSSVVTKGKTEKTNDDASEEDSSEESDEEPETKKPNTVSTASILNPKIMENDGSTESSDSDSDDEPAKAQQPRKSTAGKTSVATNVEDTSSEGESSEESSDDEKSNAQEAKLKPVKKKPQESDSEESTDEDSEDEPPSQAPKKKDMDVEMVDTARPGKPVNQISDKRVPKTPGKPQNQAFGSKTLFVGNLSYSVMPEDVENLFKEVANIEDVRFSRDQDGNFKGFAHVEFASVEDAQKALEELNGQDLFGRPLRLNYAIERGSYAPHSKENKSFQKGGRAQGQTLFVRGFDKSLGEDEIRSALQEHFGSCGEVTRVSIPTDFESGAVKGIAYLDFKDSDGMTSALELNGSELGGYSLFVEQAKPRGNSQAQGGGEGDWSGGRGSGGRGSGRSGGRGGRSGGREGGGRFGGRDGGGRFGSAGGRGGRGGGRGRGAPNKIDINGSVSRQHLPGMAVAGLVLPVVVEAEEVAEDVVHRIKLTLMDQGKGKSIRHKRPGRYEYLKLSGNSFSSSSGGVSMEGTNFADLSVS
ncbi:hypothetical protein Dimus_019477 [Dionaea muscipula]